jgi:hypothetical protein
MQFDTKIAVVIRTDLEPWQKLNVASFLAGGIAAAFPECIGEPHGDASGTKYLSLIGQPILIYGADRPALSRALERALARNVTPAVYTEDMFRTTHDAANREVVRARRPSGDVPGLCRDVSYLDGPARRTRRTGQTQAPGSVPRLDFVPAAGEREFSRRRREFPPEELLAEVQSRYGGKVVVARDLDVY